MRASPTHPPVCVLQRHRSSRSPCDICATASPDRQQAALARARTAEEALEKNKVAAQMRHAVLEAQVENLKKLYTEAMVLVETEKSLRKMAVELGE